MEKHVVNCLRGGDRHRTAARALASLRLPDLRGRRVVVKPNVVCADNPLACTHPDTLDAALEFFAATDADEVVVAEGTSGETLPAMRALGLQQVCERRGVEVVDLNRSPGSPVSLVGPDLAPWLASCAALPLEPDVFLVSLALVKTHDCVLATLGLKNAVMGALQKNERGDSKRAIHEGGCRLMHLNLFLLSRRLAPHAVLLDGVVGMEGDGPIYGDPVPLGVTLASTDWLAADLAGLEVMGIQREDVGYLDYAHRERAAVPGGFAWKVAGDRPPSRRPFRLHGNCAQQLAWKDGGG